MDNMAGYRALACAVIEQALEDMKIQPKKVPSKQRTQARIQRDNAFDFMRGAECSDLEFWCETAGLDREALQNRLFGKYFFG